MPHGRHIYAKSSDMTKAKMCTYPQSDHALPHWKYVLRCCAECLCINIPEKYPQYGFTFITSLDVLLIMVEFHRKTKNMLYL